MVSIFTENKIDTTINDEEWVLQRPEKKEIKRSDSQGGDDVQDEQKNEEEEGKPKFDIYDYKWTQSNGRPKSLPQWFVKTKNTRKLHFSTSENGTQNTAEKFDEFYRLIDEEVEENKEQKDYRKINLLIQLRSDIFKGVEEDPVEQEPDPVEEVQGEDDIIELKPEEVSQ